MKPEIILFCQGGIVQSISSNIKGVKVIYLDEDIFEDNKLEKEYNTFDERYYNSVDIYEDPLDWEELKDDTRETWDDELDKILKARS